MVKRSKKHQEFASIQETVAGRRFYLVFGTLMILGGAVSLGLGRLHYQNYRGDNVFAPFAILIGILALAGSFRNTARN